MKVFTTAVALATLITTPLFAQTARHATKNARAQAQQTHSGNSRWDVYVGGKHIGRDPDAFIRSQLMNDPQQGGNDAGGGAGE
jgi:heat shock protein HslJ